MEAEEAMVEEVTEAVVATEEVVTEAETTGVMAVVMMTVATAVDQWEVVVTPREVQGHMVVVVVEGGEEEVADTRLVLESLDTHLAGRLTDWDTSLCHKTVQ